MILAILTTVIKYVVFVSQNAHSHQLHYQVLQRWEGSTGAGIEVKT